MSLTPIPFKPGLIKDDPPYSAQGYAIDTQWMRWVGRFARSRGGWSKLLSQQFEGIARGELTWQSNSGVPYAGFGTECKLYVQCYGFIANITPQRSTGTLGADPLSTTIGDETITVTHASHGALSGDTVFLGNLTATGGITLAPSGSIPAAAFTTQEDSHIIQINWVGHGLQTGWELIISGAAAVGGITPDGTFLVRVIDANYLQIYFPTAATSTATGGGTPTYIARRPFEVTVVNANSYTIEYDTPATSTATGGGASGQYLYEINCGRLFGSAGTGFGSAGYSTGGYGASSPGGVSPRDATVWCLQNYGEELLASRIGTTIYRWQLNWSTRAQVLTNAPAQVQWFVVTPNRTVMALGCTDEAGDFDAMLIRYTDSEDPTTWVGTLLNNAGDIKLNSGSRIISGVIALDAIYVFTDTTLFQIEFVGNFEQMYRDNPIGVGFGLISPRAVTTLGVSLYWMTPEANFAKFSGGGPVELPCMSKVWLKDRLASGQNFKIFSFPDAQYNEITWGIATSPTFEITDYISVTIDLAESTPDGAAGWNVGTFSRSAWIDVQEGFRSRLAWGLDGYIYEQEQGNSADGGVITRYVEWDGYDLEGQDGSKGDRVMNVNAIVIDNSVSSGTLLAYLYFRRDPDGPRTTKGPYTISTSFRRSLKGQGNQMAFRLESGTNNDKWAAGIIRADVTPGARR